MKQITCVLGYDFQSMVGSETHSVLNAGGQYNMDVYLGIVLILLDSSERLKIRC